MTPKNRINEFRSKCNKALTEQARLSGWSNERVSWLRKQIDEHTKMCHSLRKAVIFGQHQKTARLQSRIVGSFASRLCGKLYESKYGKYSHKPLLPTPWNEFERQVNRVPLVKTTADACHVYAVFKKNGEVRWLNSPGPRTRQAQRVLANILYARLPQNFSEFNSKGKGREAAVAEIIRQIEDKGISTFIVFDFKNFFSSVRPEHLQWLNLPKHVLDTVFFNKHVVQITQKGLLLKTETARQGLPQGAIVSGQIASALLRRELRCIGGALGKVTYVDDGVIGASSPVQAHKIAKALKARFANLKGGPISFKKMEVRRLSTGFEFLGYWIQGNPCEDGVSLEIIPGLRAKKKFIAKLFKKFHQYRGGLDYDRAVEVFEGYFEMWKRSFRHWKPSSEQLNYTKFELEFCISDYSGLKKGGFT
ncbi:reverse transcriptase domain-containing protein [Sphingorhabdus sp.]|uniref:reverse transcriptase domain-containing protein n=1 Tax=Sphingorhabdus sp. TaxID=1902408 RepID=UPI00391CE509